MQTYTSLMAEQVLFSLRIPVRFFFSFKENRLLHSALFPKQEKKKVLIRSMSSLSINQGGRGVLEKLFNSSASQFFLHGKSA